MKDTKDKVQKVDVSQIEPLESESLIQDESVAEVKIYIARIVNLYFRSYTENTIMEYDTFLRFCRDFGIFPELCNKSVLHSIFYNLAYANSSIASNKSQELGNHQWNNYQLVKSVHGRTFKPMPSEAKKKVLKSGEFLGEQLFVDALVLCAVKSKAFEKETTPLEKILHFMEKIIQSQGIVKVKKMVGKTRYNNWLTR